jgi:hypothetical protein
VPEVKVGANVKPTEATTSNKQAAKISKEQQDEEAQLKALEEEMALN